ncbi:MAG: hypothetical protein WCH11_07860, partial [Bdellovibrio sp.]
KDFQILLPSISPHPGLSGFFEFAWEQLKDRSDLQFEHSDLDSIEKTNEITSKKNVESSVSGAGPTEDLP